MHLSAGVEYKQKHIFFELTGVFCCVMLQCFAKRVDSTHPSDGAGLVGCKVVCATALANNAPLLPVGVAFLTTIPRAIARLFKLHSSELSPQQRRLYFCLYFFGAA